MSELIKHGQTGGRGRPHNLKGVSVGRKEKNNGKGKTIIGQGKVREFHFRRRVGTLL